MSTPAVVVGVVAVLSLWSGLLLLGLFYEAPPRGATQPLRRIPSEPAEGFRALRRYPDAGRVVWVALAQVFTCGCLNVFLVVVALELLETGEPGVGVLTAAIGAGAVAGSLGASILVSGRHLAIVEGVGVALWGLPLILSRALPTPTRHIATSRTGSYGKAPCSESVAAWPQSGWSPLWWSRFSGAVCGP